jgi:aldos-2-ulose dehydratase/isomerase family protein/VCBS repeat protein
LSKVINMQRKMLALAAAAACVTVLSAAGQNQASSGQVEFRAHDIEAKFPGGYAVQAVDINKDGKLDVIGVSQRVPEIAWYENPTWERHVIVDGLAGVVNFAASDLDGDGIPELAYESAFAMSPASSEGLVWLAKHNGDPRQKWTTQQIDKFPTSHHIAWADVDGDGKKELINAPLVGSKSAAPTYDQDKAPLFFYRQGDWKRETITNDVNGIIHRARQVAWDGNRRDQLLVTSFDGITLYRASGRGGDLKWESQLLSPGHNTDKAPRLGASDVGIGKNNGKRFLAAVEPWHGNEIVVYTDRGGTWERRVIFNTLTEGHEVAVADLNGDGRDDIVAGDRNSKSPGVHVMYAPADPNGEWQHQLLDQGTMAASGCVAADLNGDRRIDIVCIGASTANLKWYENVRPAAPTSAGP